MTTCCFVQIEYREPLSGVGRMPGGRTKLEGGPNDREAETAMLIEKAIMPLFPAGFNQNVTVSAQCLSRVSWNFSCDIHLASSITARHQCIDVCNWHSSQWTVSKGYRVIFRWIACHSKQLLYLHHAVLHVSAHSALCVYVKVQYLCLLLRLVCQGVCINVPCVLLQDVIACRLCSDAPAESQ